MNSKKRSPISSFFKRVRKNKRFSVDFYKSSINYVSLFNDGTIVTIVWLPEKGWPVAYISHNVKKLIGYSSKELNTGKFLFENIIHPDDIFRIRNEVSVNLKGKKKYYEQKYRIKTSSGSYIWIRDYSVPVWKENIVTQINGYIYDITIEAEAENLLQMNELRLNNVIDATGAGIWEWNLQSDYVRCNANLAHMLGYSLEELEPYTLEKWEESLHPEDLGKFRTIVEENLAGRRDKYDIECRVRHRAGHWIWIHSIGKIIEWDLSGQPLIMTGSQIDVTHQKDTEAMLYHSEKISALGRLSGGISNDLNNQLMKIRGTAELAKIWDSKPHYRSSLDTIESLCDSASWLIHQLMEFSGHHVSHREICDLGKILWELSELLNHTFEKEIIVESEISTLKMQVTADSSLLKKAFFNICFNAKEAMASGGILKIQAAAIFAEKSFITFTGDLPMGNYVRIDFSDEGAGIKETDLDKIFEPFFTTKISGTQGLGLAKVVSIIKEHKGGIQVKSTLGRGTEFTVFLPLEVNLSDEMMKRDLKVTQDFRISGEILIIDDELMICQLLTQYFSEMNWNSLYFTKPEDSIEYFERNSNKVGLVILDRYMPGYNGDQVLEKLISIEKDIRVLFISGYANDMESISKCENVIGFVNKPVKLDNVRQIVVKNFSL